MEDEFADLSAFQISPEDQARIAAIQRAESAKPESPWRKRRAEPFVQITHSDAVAGYMALGVPTALVWYALLYREWAEKRGTVRVPTASFGPGTFADGCGRGRLPALRPEA
jgi:hypothetical protein